MKRISQIMILLILLTLIGSTSCQPASILEPGQTLVLATSTENKVEVTIALARDESGQSILSATFTPQNPSLHLYSKDIPKTGINGLGRPTLLELSKDSPMQAIGELTESAPPQIPAVPPFELLTYPVGSITLSLHIQLPNGNSWVNDEVIVTYMACDELGCRPPIQQKPIAIKIPSQGLLQ